eukprot:scaffold54349_cov68-Phaeocystis_antarctica.AAC.5
MPGATPRQTTLSCHWTHSRAERRTTPPTVASVLNSALLKSSGPKASHIHWCSSGESPVGR